MANTKNLQTMYSSRLFSSLLFDAILGQNELTHDAHCMAVTIHVF